MSRLYYHIFRDCSRCGAHTVHACCKTEPDDYFCIECRRFTRRCARCGKDTPHRLNRYKDRLKAICLKCIFLTSNLRRSKHKLTASTVVIRNAIIRSVTTGESYATVAAKLGKSLKSVARQAERINRERARAGKPPLKSSGAHRILTDKERGWLVALRNRLRWQGKKASCAVLAELFAAKSGKRIQVGTIDKNLRAFDIAEAKHLHTRRFITVPRKNSRS